MATFLSHWVPVRLRFPSVQVTFDLTSLVVSQTPFNLEDALSQGPVREESILSAISREIYAIWQASHALLHFLLSH